MTFQTELNNVPTHQPTLHFSFNMQINTANQGLQLGKLILVNGNSKLAYSATSGLPRYQYLAASKIRGKGRIPTCEQAGLENYWVATSPVFLPNTKGVNGNFYPISPFKVWVEGCPRSDLGIHRDTNVPGSAGCCVVTLAEHWRLFEQQMKTFATRNIIRLPLYVS